MLLKISTTVPSHLAPLSLSYIRIQRRDVTYHSLIQLKQLQGEKTSIGEVGHYPTRPGNLTQALTLNPPHADTTTHKHSFPPKTDGEVDLNKTYRPPSIAFLLLLLICRLRR